LAFRPVRIDKDQDCGEGEPFVTQIRTSVAKDSTKTTIEADGLRYRSKAPGSPFAATSSFGAATMSCFLCGKHRPRAMLKSKKLLGKSQPVCSPSCKELDVQLTKP
jgi:hypothetical protein